METKQYDLFINMAGNLDLTPNELISMGLTPNNTALQSRSAYKSDPWVRELFTENGVFDENKLDKFYDNALILYNNLADDTYKQAIKDSAIYHRSNIFAKPELRRKGPEFTEINVFNPYQTLKSTSILGLDVENDLSADELMLANKVLLNPTTAGDDLSNAKWGDAPNGHFGEYFFDTLVQATWDSDGTHVDPFTGDTVEHHAGDLKTDDTGNFYYEKLDGRSVYGKNVLNKMNVLTTDGSFWNKIDPFDSDDREQKSIGGSIVKNVALAGSMFIPYVGPWIAAASIGTQLAGLGATFGKMLLGSDNPTLSAIEGWSKSLDPQLAKTEYALNHTWCWENMINLVGDIFKQLKELRVIFDYLPGVIKGSRIATAEQLEAKLAEFNKIRQAAANTKIKDLHNLDTSELIKATSAIRQLATSLAKQDFQNFVKSSNNLGKILSQGYMTAITVGDTYEEAKLAGASDLEATLLTLGYAAGEYSLLNTGLGEWIMPELRASRMKNKAIARALVNNLPEVNKTSLKQLSNEGKKDYVKRLFNIGKNVAKAEYSTGEKTLKATLASATGEGVEEVSEEVLADFAKGCYNAVNWLLGDSSRMNSFGYNASTGDWDLNDIRDRYGMSLVGGFFGGGLTNLATNYHNMKSFSNMTSKEAISELVDMSRNGGLDNFVKLVKKMDLGNKHLSPFNIELADNGVLFMPSDERDSLDAYAKKAIINQAKFILDILNSNNVVSDNKFLDINTLSDLRFAALQNSTTAGLYILRYNDLSTDIVKLVNDIQSIKGLSTDKNGDGVATDKEKRESQLSDEDLALLKLKETALKEKQKELKDILDGKMAPKFVSTALFEMNTALSGIFTNPTFTLWVERKYGKKVLELSDTERKVAEKQYGNWKATDGRELLELLAEIYQKMAESSSGVITKYADEYKQIPQELVTLQKQLAQIYPYFETLLPKELLEYAALLGDLFNKTAQETAEREEQIVAEDLIRNIPILDNSKILQQYREQINAIDPNLPSEERIKEYDDLRNRMLNESYQMVAQNLQDYIAPFVKRGYVNTETKNLLTSLVNLIFKPINEKYLEELEKEDNGEYAFGEENPYLNQYAALLKQKKAIENLPLTPIEAAVNEFSISLGQEPINLTELLTTLNDTFNNTKSDVSKFVAGLYTKDLNNAIWTLLMYKASILGARTDSINVDNLFGYNATVNEISGTKLAEIDSKTADLFLQDIDTNLNKLMFYRNLNSVNLGLKLNRADSVGLKTEALIFKRLKNIVTVPDDDPLKTWNGFTEFLQKINSILEYLNLLDKNSYTVSDDTRKTLEKEKIDIRNAIYDFFLANLDDPNKLTQFISTFNLYTKGNKILNENLDGIDDNAMLHWIAALASVRASDFYSEYREILDENAENPIAPIVTQELAVQLCYANILNGDMFSRFIQSTRENMKQQWLNADVNKRKELLKQLDLTDDEAKGFIDDNFADYCFNFIPVPKYDHMVFIEGIAGSGKTSSVFSLTIALLKKFHPELLDNVSIIHGADISSADKLKTSLGLDKAETFDRKKFMTSINPKWKEYLIDLNTGLFIIPESDYVLGDDNEFRSSAIVADSTNPPSLIVIDEIGKFSNYDIDQINDFAKKYGITVITAGDFDQSTMSGTHKVKIGNVEKKWELDLLRTLFIRSPKLGISLRTDNSIKTANQQKLLAYLSNYKEKLTLDYFENETGLYGDKVILLDRNADNSSKWQLALAEVDKMIKTLKKGEKIGYIYNDQNSELYKALNTATYKPYIDFKEGSKAQGLEAQYYIIEADRNTHSPGPYLRDIYTGVTRAQQGSLLIVPATFSSGYECTFDSLEVPEIVNEPLSKENIITLIKKRKNLLNNITDGKATVYTKRTIPDQNNSEDDHPTNKNKNPEGLPPAAPVKTRNDIKLEFTDLIGKATTLEELNNIVLLISNSTFPDIVQDSDITDLITKKSEELKPKPPTGATELTHADMIDRFGKEADIDHITINIDGEDIDLPLMQIPFVNFKDESGTNNIVNHGHRNIVLVNIGGFYMPFYVSTGNGGKKNVPIDKWYPIFGIASNSGWLNKGTEEQINSFYGSEILLKIAEALNVTLPMSGMDIKGPMNDEGPQIDFINQHLHPTENHTPETPTKFNAEVDRVTNLIKEKIRGLQKTQKPVENPFANNIAPESQFDYWTDADYLAAIEAEYYFDQQRAAELDGDGFSMQLHSFNTFELGVDVDAHDMPVPVQGNMASLRIDSVNGLMHIDKLHNIPTRTVTDYRNIIALLRDIFFNTKAKNDVLSLVENVLGLSNSYITFAYKSTARNGDKNKANGRTIVDSKPTAFTKSSDERSLYNGSLDVRSSEIHNKSLVAIIGDNANGNLLEIPLFALTSPMTVMRLENDLGVQPYAALAQVFYAEVSKSDIHTAVLKVIDQFDNDPKYQDLVNLFKLYNFTDNGVFYIKDTSWTPVNNLTIIGPQIVTNKGIYLDVDGFYMNERTNPENTWPTLSQFRNNPNITVSRIQVSSTGRVDGYNAQIVKPGHPFVLASYSKGLNNTKSLIEYYIKQQRGEVPKKVELIYILPPSLSLEEYVDHAQLVMQHERKTPIGSYTTSYKLMQYLIRNDLFKDLVKQRLGEDIYNSAQLAIATLEAMTDPNDIREYLFNILSWGELGSLRVCSLFAGVMANIGYTRNSISLPETVISKYKPGMDLMTLILKDNGIDKIFYNVKYAKDQQSNGYFFEFDDNLIPGHEFRIHGKFDSPRFLGNLSLLIAGWVKLIRQGNTDKEGVTHYYSTDSVTYWTEAGGIGNSRIGSKKLTQEEQVEAYLKNVLGDEFLDEYSLALNSEDISLGERLQVIADTINIKDNQRIAFVLGNKIHISKKNSAFSGSYVLDNLKTNINNITEFDLMDDAGLPAYHVEYDAKTGGANMISTVIHPTLTITHIINTEEEFTTLKPIFNKLVNTKFDYLGDKTSLLECDPDIEKLLNADFLSFNTLWETLTPDPSGEEYSRLSLYQELYKTLADEQEKALLDSMIKFEKQEEVGACPTTIKVFF